MTIILPRKVRFTPIPLSDITSEQVQFFWNPYIPAGALTLMYGHGGVGKSWISCSLAAMASTGTPFPGHSEPVPPQKVLIVSAEDDAKYVLKPRMEKLGANMANVFVIEEPFVLDKAGTAGLKDAMTNMEAAFVILDPLVAFLGGKMDINKSNEARAITGPLAEAAQDTGCAVVLIHHERKGSGGRTASLAMGSADFINGVRSAIHVGETKDGQKFMAHAKHNWSRQGPTLEFSIDNDVLRWQGQYQEPTVRLGRPDVETVKARTFLQQFLSDGPHTTSEVLIAAALDGISERTLKRAKIGVVQMENKKGVWCWSLQQGRGTPTPEDTLAKLGRGTPTASIFMPSGV